MLRTSTRTILSAVSMVACANVIFDPAYAQQLPAQAPGTIGLERAMRAKDRHTHGLLSVEGCLGTGMSLGAENQPVITVYLERPGVAGIPRQLEGVPVRTVVTGRIIALTDPTARQTRPVPIGVSTGLANVGNAGTVGCRITMDQDGDGRPDDVDGDGKGDVFALSNNHVYANLNNALIGDDIVQPGVFDGGSLPDDFIGTLFDFEPIDFSGGENTLDAAIVLSSQRLLDNASPCDDAYGTPGSNPVVALPGMRVMKYGRTTKATFGEVADIDVTCRVCVECADPSCKACSKEAIFTGQIAVTPGSFSSPGDSGSLIVTDDPDGNRNPVGLLFAGGDTRTIANPIDLVLSRFHARVDGRGLATKQDFDGDGFADLTIGVPGEAIGNITEAGAAHVIRGSSLGLTVPRNQFWSQQTAGITSGVPEAGDQFGASIAAGDFDGDGLADLAIGVPSEALGNVVDAGAVHVVYGSQCGLSDVGNQFWSQRTQGIQSGLPEPGDRFGSALTTADFNGDGFADLAAGVPDEGIGSVPGAGGVQILYGSENGLTVLGNQFWSQATSGLISGLPEAGDGFGSSLAAGDFDGDGIADLAIGVPAEGIGNIAEAGAVHVMYGSPDQGLTIVGNLFLSQRTQGLSGGLPEDGDRFGSSLATGDFDGDGTDDLVIGVPTEDLGDLADAGGVHVIYGVRGVGLAVEDNEFWSQRSPGLQSGLPEAGDRFGSSLTTGDFDGDGTYDLVIGVPAEGLGDILEAGGVHVIYGVQGVGLTVENNQFWSQREPGLKSGLPEMGDGFGSTLNAADFNGDGIADLAIGVPAEDIGSVEDAGGVHVVFGSHFGLMVEGNQFWSQASPGIESGLPETGDTFGAALVGSAR